MSQNAVLPHNLRIADPYGPDMAKFVTVCVEDQGGQGVFRALIVSCVIYALPAFYGFILQSDVDRINAMFRKAKRWGIEADEIDLNHLYLLWLTLAYFIKSKMRITVSTTCFLKSSRLCPTWQTNQI